MPVMLLSFCGSRPRLCTIPRLPVKSSAAFGVTCRFERRLVCFKLLGRITEYGGAVPPDACVRRLYSAAGNLYVPSSFWYVPETKYCTWSVPPDTCAPASPRYPVPMNVCFGSISTLNELRLSMVHRPAPALCSRHCLAGLVAVWPQLK